MGFLIARWDIICAAFISGTILVAIQITSAGPAEHSSPASSPSFLPQLAGLRALAIAAILAWHFTQLAFGSALGFLASLGIELFFVLSGFLLTRSLLNERNNSKLTIFEKRYVLKRFYLRRILRILPLYLFVVAVAFWLQLPGVPPARDTIGWLLTLTVNIKACLFGAESLGPFALFISVSAWAQICLFWPSYLLFAPRVLLVPGAMLLVAAAPLYRWMGMNHGYGYDPIHFFTLSYCDTFGAGALLAIVACTTIHGQVFGRYLQNVGLPIGLTLSLVMALGSWLGIPESVGVITTSSAHALVFAWLLHSASTGFRGKIGTLLESGTLGYMARISYGAYVVHPFVAYSWNYRLYDIFGAWNDKVAFLSPMLGIPLVLLCAAATWYLLERPAPIVAARLADWWRIRRDRRRSFPG